LPWAAAAELMLDGDCGILPVVADGKLVGVVTDRDMYIALATRNGPASQIRVRIDKVIDTFQSIGARHRPTPHVTAA
jgi:CBS domain-containing protein